jgi:hypothetical protein
MKALNTTLLVRQIQDTRIVPNRQTSLVEVCHATFYGSKNMSHLVQPLLEVFLKNEPFDDTRHKKQVYYLSTS